MKACDFLVIGAGISGASVAYELAKAGSVIVLEAESFPGYHSTGRSAALYTPNYGPEPVRKICRLGYDFLTQAPGRFTSTALLKPRGMLSVALNTEPHELGALLENSGEEIVPVTADKIVQLVPFLKREIIEAGAYEEGVMDMDVHALYQGFLKGFQQLGGHLIVDSPVNAISRKSSVWEVNTPTNTIEASIVINAAGAWADQIGELAGLQPIGLEPKRRSAILIDVPTTGGLSDVPAIDFLGIDNYIKPETNQIMVSPGDETLVVPQDIQVDDLEIATLVDWLETTTEIQVNRIGSQWAGLRSFVADGLPVVGFDTNAPGFFWLAAQGGYGIMMAHPLARASAALIQHNQLPDDFAAVGLQEHMISPERLRRSLS